MARSIESMKQTGNEVNVELKRQDEALERIDTKLNVTDEELKQSKKLVRSIDGWWGMLKNKFAGWKYKPTEMP
jgi:hypothetical protein